MEWPKPGSLKVGRLNKGKNNVISGFIISLVLNTSMLAPRDGWSGALYTVCSGQMIAILLFNLLFRSMSSFRAWCAA